MARKTTIAACARALGFDADTVELRLFLPGEVRKIGGGPKVKYVLFTLEVVLGAIGPAALLWEGRGCGGSEPTTLSSALLQRFEGAHASRLDADDRCVLGLLLRLLREPKVGEAEAQVAA